MEILTTNPDFVLANSQGPENLSLLDSISNFSWQEVLKMSVRSPPELFERLNLQEKLGTDPRFLKIQAVETFPVFVPIPYLSRIRFGDPGDPLLAQVLPKVEEDHPAPGFTVDPLMEAGAKLGAGLLQKYSGRVLMIVTGACAIHCRYCFRRHFPYSESPKSISQWSTALNQISADPSIEEVILSGGDPLMLVDETLAQLVERLNAIPHLSRLRIHTRLPIMIPQRVTDALLRTLGQTRLRKFVVIHSNHANELDEEVAKSLGRLAETGSILLNQSVLLRGVNNDLDSLRKLSLRLLDCHVMPYYLHKNDPIAGTAQFEVSVEEGIRLIRDLQACLPGYAVPKFVQEIAGEQSKVPLGP